MNDGIDLRVSAVSVLSEKFGYDDMGDPFSIVAAVRELTEEITSVSHAVCPQQRQRKMHPEVQLVV